MFYITSITKAKTTLITENWYVIPLICNPLKIEFIVNITQAHVTLLGPFFYLVGPGYRALTKFQFGLSSPVPNTIRTGWKLLSALQYLLLPQTHTKVQNLQWSLFQRITNNIPIFHRSSICNFASIMQCAWSERLHISCKHHSTLELWSMRHLWLWNKVRGMSKRDWN